MSDQFPPPLPPAHDDGRTGPVWEQPGPIGSRFLETVRGVLLDPTAFYRTMRRSAGLGPPLTFGIAGTLIGSLIGSLYQLMFMSAGTGFGDVTAGEAAFASLFSSGCIVIVVPVFAVLGMFVGAAIYHVMLLLLGAARQPFETTMRVVAYAMGATSVLQIIPICGSVLAVVWSIVVYIIGLAQAHEIPTGKAAAAVLIPIAVCCVLTALFYAALLAVFLGAAFGGLQQ